MTSKSKNAVRGYETEIEKSREDSNWKKVIELAPQLKSRSPQHESLAHFLIGEGKLEAYLEEWPPIKENQERAQRDLSDARGYLTLATDEAGKKAGVALDAHLLLGKLNYACGNYDEALKQYKLAELNTLTEKELPVRSLRIVAESYAIMGLCLEQNAVPSSTSRFKMAERESEMIRSFEISSSLTLLYLQRGGAHARAGHTLETALQRAPILHMRAGRLTAAVQRYREMLMAVESASTQALRLTLTRQLAEVLIRGVTGQVYKAPEPVVPQGFVGSLSRRIEEHVSEGPWKPKKYAAMNQFVPRNEHEEVLLLLGVGEAMAVRDAVLSQSAEFEAARAHSLRSAIAVIDLLVLRATRWGQLCLVLESLERAMKFSFNCAHVWRQRALCAAAAATATAAPNAKPSSAHHGSGSGGWCGGLSVVARGVSARARALCARDAALRLVSANTCYKAGWIEEGIELANEALEIEEEREGDLLSRCCLYAGIGYQMKAQKTNSRIDKDAANDKSLKLLQRATQLDDNDHLSFYYLGLQYMHLGMLNDAMESTRRCLWCRAECGGGLRLAAALWSCACAGPRGARALQAAQLAAHHYPAAVWPRAAAAQLQLARDDPQAALTTGKELLALVNSSCGAVETEHNGYVELDALSDSLKDDTQSNRDAASIRAESAGAYRVERALSDGASSLCTARTRSPRADTRAHAWLLLAQLCLRLGRISAAAGCVSEAAALTPFSHLVLYTRGLVHAASSEWDEARQCYQNALAIHPTHLDSLVQLGAAYYSLGWLGLAEHCLRAAAAAAPARADTWRRLALVLRAAGDAPAAADAAAAALQLLPQHTQLPPPL